MFRLIGGPRSLHELEVQVACPRCGSDSHRQIAPTYVECIGVVGVPTGRHPSGVEGPLEEPVACGFRYHTSGPSQPGSALLCSCGTFAIGQCATCGDAVCGDHSTQTNLGRLCGECLASERAKAAAQRDNREADLRARLREEALAVIDAGLFGSPHSVRETHTRKGNHSWSLAADSVREGDDCPFHGSPRKVVGTHNGTGLGRFRREYVVCELAGWCISSYAGSDRAILLADGTISYKWYGEISLDELDGEEFTKALQDMSFHTGGSTKKLEEIISTLSELRASKDD